MTFFLFYLAIIAESFERIHRSNLAGMGILPLQFLDGQQASSLGLTGKETYSINIPSDVKPGQILTVEVNSSERVLCTALIQSRRFQVCDGRKFEVRLRLDTEVELAYFRNGGILNYMVRKLVA